MNTLGSSQPRTKRDPEKKQKKSKTVSAAPVCRLERRRGRERPSPSTLPRTYGPYESERRVRGLEGKKTQEGVRRYHAMSEEQRNEVKRKNAQCQRNWMQKMKEEGTYEAYKQRLNEQRREIQAEKKRVLVVEGWKALQSQRYEKRVESIRRGEWQWLDEQLDRPFSLRWLPLDWVESEPEEDTVQTIRADALQQMDHYL